MTNLNKVKFALENCMKFRCDLCPYADKNGAFGTCYEKMLHDTLDVIKEQEPRVMTLEEVKSLPDKADVFLEEVDCIVVAATISRQGEKWGMLPDATFFYGIESTSYESDKYYNDDYGRWWRCWTSRPTDELTRDTKWEGDSDAEVH